MFFLVTAILTASGAVVPGAVAIVAPIALGFAIQYGINPVLMGLFVINGATAGGFSPISVFGSIVNGVVEREDLAENAMLLFVSSFVFNFLLCFVVFFLFGGRKLLGHRVEPAGEDEAGNGRFERDVQEREQAGTGPKPIAGGAATTVAGGGPGARPRQDPHPGRHRLADRRRAGVRRRRRLRRLQHRRRPDADLAQGATKGAVEKVAWSTVLLICGIVMYVGLLEEIGTIDWLGEQVATIDSALLAALLICYVGAVVSAFASTTGILGALIPLAVPFLETGAVGAVGLIIALSISSSVVDSSPFSTSGALTVANTAAEHRERVFKNLMRWGMSMVVIAPPIAWMIFVVPGWL